MICPNCGRELPDIMRVCTGCSAVQRVFRRKHADVDAPEPQNVRVERTVQPDEAEARHRRAQSAQSRQGTVSSPEPRVRKPQQGEKRSLSADSSVPVGLHKQQARERVQVRHVRHAPSHIRRKVDGQPAMMDPPIYRKSHRLLRSIMVGILLATLFVGGGGGYLLFFTENGHRMMAQWGWEAAKTSAYVTLGREYVEQAYFTRALETLNVVIEREPENVDALILMAQAHTELGNVEEAKRIYKQLIVDAPQHPSAYRNLIKIYQKEGYNAEALALMKQAREATDANEFVVMLKEYTPAAPVFSQNEGRYNNEIDVTISVPEGQMVYYTIDGTDPSESGLVYQEGTKIHVSEGKMTVKAIGFTENGTPSEQVEALYTVVIPTPAAPKANYASGPYKKSFKVTLRAGDDEKDSLNTSPIVAFYYTLDGRQATTESTLYTEPIQIPIGDSVLRAIAVAKNGKVSYEMKVTYSVEGNLKKMFGSSDTFKNMELFKTGYNAFTKSWGAPKSYELLDRSQWYDKDLESYEAVYSWGTARFVTKANGSSVLYALDTSNEKMTAPRSTKVGMSAAEVMEKYRDLGHPDLDELGNRLLYNWNSAGEQFGTYRCQADGSYAIHYYYPVGEKKEIYVELSYYLDADGNVARIVWQRYLSEL